MTNTLIPKSKQQSTLRRVLQYVGKYPLSLCGTVLFAILTVAATLCCSMTFSVFPNTILCTVRPPMWTEP